MATILGLASRDRRRFCLVLCSPLQVSGKGLRGDALGPCPGERAGWVLWSGLLWVVPISWYYQDTCGC